MARLFQAGTQFTDDSGSPLNSGLVYVYDNNTSDLSTVYTDAALTLTGQNPSTLGSDGRLSTDLFTSDAHSIKVTKSAAAGGAVVPGYTRDDVTTSESWAVTTFADADTTPSVMGASVAKTANTSGTTITTFDGGRVGQTVTVLINDANTTLDFSGTALKAANAIDRTLRSGDVLRCTYDGTSWFCSIIEVNDHSASAADQDATPSVLGLKVLTTANTVGTTISALDDGFKGQRVTVIVGDANTTIDFTGTTLKGNTGANWSPGSGDHMDCVFDGTNWYCIVSDNTV